MQFLAFEGSGFRYVIELIIVITKSAAVSTREIIAFDKFRTPERHAAGQPALGGASRASH
jgi:hypothetical protein